MKYIFVIGALVLILLLVIGSVARDTDEDHAKIFLIVIDMHKEGAVLESVDLEYGHPPNLGHQLGNFTATVRARNGTPLFTFDVWDPRTRFGETEISDPAVRNQLREKELAESEDYEKAYNNSGDTDEVDLPLIIPYHQEIQTVDLIDRNSGAFLISVNISPSVDEFRRMFPRDPDMMAGPLPVQPCTQSPAGNPWAFTVAASGLAIILLACLIRLVRKS